MTAQGVIEAVASRKLHVMHGVVGLLIVVLFSVACSSSEPTEQAAPTPEPVDSTQEQDADADNEVEVAAPAPTAVPEPTIDDEDLTSITTLASGEQAEDAQGNLIAVYGLVEWPQPFDALSDAAHAEFPFFGDVQDVADPQSELVVLDVGMCAAGLNATGFGTAEFFVHDVATDALSTDPVLGRGVLARHPVVQPGFEFPSPAECTRGWLPVLWGSERAPSVARYVLVTRSDADADVERHVYQWDLAATSLDVAIEGEEDGPVATAGAESPFAAGQTVTFNQGPLVDTTVVVDGWAELIGAPSSIDGTRMVAVSIEFCPATQRLPAFGLGVDRWNVIAPIDGDLLGAGAAEDRSTSCFAGWLEFVVPFGAVPTAFFASDGANSGTGYAEWSLIAAAIPAPQ